MSNWGKAHENNTIGFGQGSANNSIGWGSVYDKTYSGETILNPSLNPFEDAQFAYSVKDLETGATNVVRVRRDIDNAEQDFSASEITDGTLDNFLNGANGFVSKSYNQTGGDNATQSSASLQPLIDNSNISYSNDYLEIPDSDDLSFTDGTNNTDFTIFTEVLFDGFNSSDRAWLVSKRGIDDGVDEEWQLTYASGQIRFFIWDINNNQQAVSFNLNPVIGQKYNLGVTLIDDQLCIFLDGVVTNTITIPSSFKFFNGTRKVRLGNETFTNILNFIGKQNTAIIWKGKGFDANGIANLNQFFN